MGVTWVSYGCHIGVIWVSHWFHRGVTWVSHGFHMGLWDGCHVAFIGVYDRGITYFISCCHCGNDEDSGSDWDRWDVERRGMSKCNMGVLLRPKK